MIDKQELVSEISESSSDCITLFNDYLNLNRERILDVMRRFNDRGDPQDPLTVISVDLTLHADEFAQFMLAGLIAEGLDIEDEYDIEDAADDTHMMLAAINGFVIAARGFDAAHVAYVVPAPVATQQVEPVPAQAAQVDSDGVVHVQRESAEAFYIPPHEYARLN